MDPLSAQLFGILGGTAAGLLAFLARGGIGTRRPTRLVVKGAAQSVRRRREIKRVGTSASTLRNRKYNNKTPPKVQPSIREANVSSANGPLPFISACPSCGLEAPYELMAEHFGGSPSHQKGRVSDESKETVPETTPDRANASDDTISTLRNLIQMLVPPRAFGRRQSQRVENPLSMIVHQLDNARITPVSPTGSEIERSKISPEIMLPDTNPGTS